MPICPRNSREDGRLAILALRLAILPFLLDLDGPSVLPEIGRLEQLRKVEDVVACPGFRSESQLEFERRDNGSEEVLRRFRTPQSVIRSFGGESALKRALTDL